MWSQVPGGIAITQIGNASELTRTSISALQANLPVASVLRHDSDRHASSFSDQVHMGTVLCENLFSMPETSYQYPFGAPRRLETSEPVESEQLDSLLAAGAEGMTIEVTRPNVGAGYFFHIKESDGGYDLLSYTGEVLTTLEDIDFLARFVNRYSPKCVEG